MIDRATVRRGRPTVAASLGDEPAIVIGDFHFAKAYELAARTETPEVVAILARTVMSICAGEVRQQAIRFRYSTGVDEYMRRIEAKTATLLAACCDIGALLAGLEDDERDALRAYGRLLGLAFQIADDVLDYTGSEDEIGKPIGHDIAEGFATLPLMLARDEPSVAKGLEPLLLRRATSWRWCERAAVPNARSNAHAETQQMRAAGLPGCAVERQPRRSKRSPATWFPESSNLSRRHGWRHRQG